MKRMSQNATAAAAATGMTENMNTVGLGYGIAIAVGILVLVSTIMLASYVCVRVHGRGGAARVRGLGGLGGVETGADPRGNSMVTSYGDGGSDGRGAGDRREEDTATISTGYGEWTIGGLDEATLESCPKFSYAEKKLFHGYQHADDSSCSICLADYRDGELIRMLPDCRHSFHAACVDAWLRLHASCPMCRTSPLPTPVSTPLSELIPLARHPIQSHYRL